MFALMEDLINNIRGEGLVNSSPYYVVNSLYVESEDVLLEGLVSVSKEDNEYIIYSLADIDGGDNIIEPMWDYVTTKEELLTNLIELKEEVFTKDKLLYMYDSFCLVNFSRSIISS